MSEVTMGIMLRDFQPINNNWTPDVDGPKYCCQCHEGKPQYLIDGTTNRKYLNESRGVVRVKCALLTLGTPIVHAVASIVNVAIKMFKLLTFSHFRAEKNEKPYNFQARLASAGIDLLRVIATPLSLVGLELAALYGLFRPYDGRKLYATIERATYGRCVLAPCFQPSPQFHAFGGDINSRDAF